MRRLAALLAAALLGALLLATPAAAQTGDGEVAPTTIPVEEGGDRPGIIPDPGTGSAPDGDGDRGGSSQLIVLGALVVGLALTAGAVVRAARRADRQRAGT